MISNWRCSNVKYQIIAEENPDALIIMEDSLLNNNPTKKIKNALITSHNTIGKFALNDHDYKKAIGHFSRAVELCGEDTLSLYNLFIAQGHALLDKGNKDGLWEAILKYYKASQLQPQLGEPHYYIGQCYQKIGDTDFDLISESYEMALELVLPSHLRKATEAEYSLIMKREKQLKEFWK